MPLFYTLSVFLIWRIHYQKYVVALAGVGQWFERQPVNQKVSGSVRGQGACLGCGPGPQLGACEKQPIDVSLAH